MIKFVYFDVGGVVIEDFGGTNKWEELKAELGITAENSEKFDTRYDVFEDEVNLGRDVNDFIPILIKEFGSKNLENYDLLIDGFVSKFYKNSSIWPVIEEIHKECKVGLLTNMYPQMLAAIKAKGILPDINWNVIIDSSIEKVRKPNREIYELAEKRADTRGKEILFVDNGIKNIEGAKKLGWQTFIYDPKNFEQSSNELLSYWRTNK